MSRDQSAPAAASAPTPQNPIWKLAIKLPSGSLKTNRTQRIGKNAFQVNAKENYCGLLAIWMQMMVDITVDNKKFIQQDLSKIDSEEQFSLLVPGYTKGLAFSVWKLIISFGLGDDYHFVGCYALGSRSPALLQNTSTLFPLNSIHPNQLVEAVLHGDEKMVRDILKAKPKLLLKTGAATDFSARTFTGSALRVAIAVGDVAPNKNSTGIVEIMLEHLQRSYPENYKTLLEQQALSLYSDSLDVYVRMQGSEIARLCKLGGELPADDAQQAWIDEKIKRAQANLHEYEEALRSNDLTLIFAVHVTAQKDNVFNGFGAAIAAIENASDADIQAVLDDPTIDSPLSIILKQFRSAFTQHSHSEKSVNCEHLLKIFELYDAIYWRGSDAVLNFKNRELFWCHLVGGVQRDLAAGDAQVFTNPGLHTTVRDHERVTRSFDFKYYSGKSFFPLSFDSNSGLGYKFTAGAWAPMVGGDTGVVFRTYLEQKHSRLAELYAAQRVQHPTPDRSCCLIQ